MVPPEEHRKSIRGRRGRCCPGEQGEAGSLPHLEKIFLSYQKSFRMRLEIVAVGSASVLERIERDKTLTQSRANASSAVETQQQARKRRKEIEKK